MAVSPPPEAPLDASLIKAERDAALLAEHEQRMDRLKRTRRWECKQCGTLIAKYRGTVSYFEEPCRKCKTMNELTTEPLTAS
jgi:phage FluMu protein Com